MFFHKKKTLYITLFFLILTVMCGIFLIYPKNNKTCYGTVIGRINTAGKEINYELSHKIRISEDGKGYDNLRGVFKKEKETYNISRTLNFNYKKSQGSGIYQYQIISTHVFSTENIPENVLSRYLTFIQEGPVRYVGFESIGDNNFLISDSGGPSFICNYH